MRPFISGYVNVLRTWSRVVNEGDAPWSAAMPDEQVMAFTLSSVAADPASPLVRQRAISAISLEDFEDDYPGDAFANDGQVYGSVADTIIVPLVNQTAAAMVMAAQLREANVRQLHIACRLGVEPRFILNGKLYPILYELRVAPDGLTFPADFDSI